MKGSIGFDSEYGVGSTFWFELTFDIAEADEVPGIVATEILLVDSNEASAKNMIGYFERVGCQMDWVSDYQALYRLLDGKLTQGERYHGLILSMTLGLNQLREIVASEDVTCCIRPEHIGIAGSLADKIAIAGDTLLSRF